jgi:hypothetical protein
MNSNNDFYQELRRRRAAANTLQHLSLFPQRNDGQTSNVRVPSYPGSGHMASNQQRKVGLHPDEVKYYQTLEDQGRLEAIVAYRRSVGIDVSEIEELFPSKYVVKSPERVQYERVQLVDCLSDFLAVVPEDTVAQVITDIDQETWIEKVDSGIFWAPPSHFLNGVAYDDSRSVYDVVSDIVNGNTENGIDILYVPGWRDSMQGYFSLKETRVVSIPPDEKWLDVYFLSTFMPIESYANMLVDLKYGIYQSAYDITRAALTMLYEVPVGSTPRGFRYVVLAAADPECNREKFLECVHEGWYDEVPVLVGYGAMGHAWEPGSSLVVVDLYNGVGVYFSRNYVQKYFKELYKDKSGQDNPGGGYYYVDVSRIGYPIDRRWLKRYAYAHFCRYLYGDDIGVLMFRQLQMKARQTGNNRLFEWHHATWHAYNKDSVNMRIPNPKNGVSTVCCWSGQVVSPEWFVDQFDVNDPIV